MNYKLCKSCKKTEVNSLSKKDFDLCKICSTPQKIVINICHGGFSLSYNGMMKYAKLKGIKLYGYDYNLTNKILTRVYKKTKNLDG